MKNKNKILLLISMILMVLFTIITPQVQALGGFAFSYTVPWTTNVIPFSVNVGGVERTIFCREAGGSFRSSFGKIDYYYDGSGELTPTEAYAINAAGTNSNVKQAVIWLNNRLSHNLESISDRDGYAEALEIMSKANRFGDYYSKLQEKGSQIKINDTNPKLVGSSNGTYKIGPFSLDFYKSEFSGIDDIYLTDSNNNRVDITSVVFGNYVGNKDNIQSGEEFYVTCNTASAANAKSLKLNVSYKFIQASGNYYFYQANPRWRAGKRIQNLISVDANVSGKEDVKTSPEVELTMDVAGRVFLDVAKVPVKAPEPNGIIDDLDTDLDEDVKVTLYDKETNEVVATTTTRGRYEFKGISAAREYYVTFEYNGLKYEPTTYQTLKKYTYNDNQIQGPFDTSESERSYASERREDRRKFNNKFAEINSNTNYEDNKILAYADLNGEGNQKYYKVSDSQTRLNNINCGLIERQIFDMNLTKDLANVEVKVNDFSEIYKYESRKDEDMQINLRGSDIYQRDIRKTDLEKANVEVYVTYKIRLYNETSYSIRGEVTGLIDYYDEDYTYVSSYKVYGGNKTDISWNTQYSKVGKYNVMTTDATKGDILYTAEGIDAREESVYVTYKVNDVKALINANDIIENFAEILSYKTYYGDNKKDLNGKVIRHEIGEEAGLIDRDSKPGNFNPDTDAVRKFVETSRTDEYKKLSSEDKAKYSRPIFEDDADNSPGLKLVISNEVRKLSGNVWEEKAIQEQLEQGIRIGNGILDDGEYKIKGIVVELVDKKTGEAIDTTTNEEGYYEFTGFLPGEYIVRFSYGTGETLTTGANKDENGIGKNYTGEAYKSTIYDEDRYKETDWYKDENRYSDAKDDWERRQTVNQNFEELTNQKSELLKIKAESITSENEAVLKQLEELTKMFAETKTMRMEIEYARTETNYGQVNDMKYEVNNIDFGIIERPHTELNLEKNVTHIKVTTSDGQTLFDANPTDKTSNMSKVGRQIQTIMDDNLIHGATIEITYGMKITNKSEYDYTDEQFYNTGKSKNEEEYIVKTQATQVVDYIANNLYFNKELNSQWEKIEIDDLKNQINSGVDLSNQKVIVKAKTDNNLLKELKPDESTQESTMILTKVMSTSDNEDDLKYNNKVEIISLKNNVGRNTFESIPGNLNPSDITIEDLELDRLEQDTGMSEEIIVQPPFGKNNIVYYIIGTIALAAVLGGGIYFIKKKVL